jgi:hydroxymethylglutaryl-CoA lyase
MASCDVVLRDCGPRDGLQSEAAVPPQARAELAARLARAGLSEVEVAAFVSPRAVPAMAGAAEVLEALGAASATAWWVLVPNRRGAELATESGARSISFTLSASPAYGAKNTGLDLDGSLRELEGVRAVAPAARLDAVISCCFGSPFEDELITPAAVAAVADRVREIGADRVTLADTTGAATPRRVAAVVGEVGGDVGLHLHDTRGTALANALAGLDVGVRRFDTAVGGLGGSPFAPGAGGNLATEDLVLVLDDLGWNTGIDLTALLEASAHVASLIGRPVPSRVAAAGPLPPFDV